MIFIAQVHPDNLKLFAPILHFFTLVLLILVLFFGVGKSADRWLDLYVIRFQPSELMKIFVPLMLASYYSDKPLPPKVKYIFIAILIALVPVFLIMWSKGPSCLIGPEIIFSENILISGLTIIKTTTRAVTTESPVLKVKYLNTLRNEYVSMKDVSKLNNI